MVEINREELAWAAGFFDGEGHIGSAVTGKKRLNKHLHIQLVQTADGPLERFQRAVGFGKIYGPYKSRGNKRPYKQLHIDKFEQVQQTICLLWPWLSEPKRQQTRVAFQDYHAYLNRPYVPRGPQRKENQTHVNAA